MVMLMSITVWGVICSALVASAAARMPGNGFVEIVGTGPGVRLTSGQMALIEGLQDGRWTGQKWVGDGHFNFGYASFSEPAFEIAVKHDPTAESGTRVNSG